MFDAALRHLFGKRKRTKSERRQREGRRPVREVHPDAPAAEAGTGFTTAAWPRGFADPFDPLALGSPAARLDRADVAARETTGLQVSLEGAVADRPAPTSKSKRPESRLPERIPAVVAARTSVNRDRMQDNVDELKKAMEKPELGATMGQRLAGEEAARAAKRGDRQALRQALASLVQKLDLSSPKDMVVLIKQEAGIQSSGQMHALLAKGKMTLEATPGGRIFGKISPILRDYAPVDMKGEVDGAWSGMAERFASGAKGKVDVVLGTAGPSGAAGPPGGAGPAQPAGGASVGGAAPASNIPGGLSVGEVGAEVGPPMTGGMGAPSGMGSLRVGEVGEADAEGRVPIAPGAPAMSVRGSPMTVGESADQSQRVVPQAGMPAPGAIQVGSMDAMEMPANTPHRVTPQPGMPAAGTLNVQPVEMPADTPQSTVVRQAGRTAVAGQMTLKEVLERNPEITEVRLQQVTQTPSGGALKSLGSMARNALLQRLQGGVGGSSMD